MAARGRLMAPRCRLAQVFSTGILARISWVSGKRPSCFFEKISWPSSVTSNWPPEPRMSVASIPRAVLISAAKLEARGR